MKFNTTISPKGNVKALFLTHVPYDLTNYSNFEKLDLIESHTGVLKSRYEWYTKFYKLGDADLRIIPFYKKMLLVFGDRVVIQPSDIKLRRLILEVAQNRRWTQLTTVDKVMHDLELSIREPMVVDFIRSLPS
jgi:hypothetical protein